MIPEQDNMNLEVELIQKFRQGDKSAIKLIYQTYYGRMLVVCMRYAPDKDSALDFLQEGFMKVFQQLHKFSQTGSLEGWIRRIMVNNAIDNLRTQRNFFVSENALEVLGANIEHSDFDYDEAWETEQIQKATVESILSILQELTPVYRTVFNLYIIENYSHAQIAQILGISESTSRANLAKAKNRIKKTYYSQLSHHEKH